MLFKWLFRRLFGKDVPAGILYVPSIMGIFLCYWTFRQHRLEDTVANIVVIVLDCAIILMAISMNFRRFIDTVRKPYQRGNIHAALGSVFATVTMFAAIYAILSLYLPGSIVGISASSPLDECVNAVYFSATIIATVGFGDIHAVASLAKVFVTVEMMSFFVFFVVILGAAQSFIKPQAVRGPQDEPAKQ